MKATFFEEMSPAIEWNELARKICKRNEENNKNNKEVLDEIDDTDDYDDDDDSEDNDEENDDDSDENDPDDEVIIEQKKEETSTKKPVKTEKVPVKSTAKPKHTTSQPPSVVDSDDKNEESETDEEYDYDEKNDIDDSEDREDESIVEESSVKPDKNLLLDSINAIKKVENRIFGELNKKTSKMSLKTILNIFVGTNLDDEDEEVIIEQAAQYRFLWPMLIFMLSIFSVLLIIMLVIAQCMRRRGERYRQALLQSKNSIIYQKLSEEINTPQTPKVHRYTPIAQV